MNESKSLGIIEQESGWVTISIPDIEGVVLRTPELGAEVSSDHVSAARRFFLQSFFKQASERKAEKELEEEYEVRSPTISLLKNMAFD